MQAGRELDALVAKKVMGLEDIYKDPHPSFGDGLRYRACAEANIPTISGTYYESGTRAIPKYSTDLSAAWTVVEKMYELGNAFCIERAHRADKWTVHFIPKAPPPRRHDCDHGFVTFIEDMERISDEAESLPHAICLTALRVLGQDG